MTTQIMITMASGFQRWGLFVGIVVCLLTLGQRGEAVSDGKDPSDPKPPSTTCNTTMWDSVKISIPSVPEVMDVPHGNVCNETYIFVEDIVWRCEKRYCCEESCNCENSSLSEEPCMVTPPQVTPVELVCLVQHKMGPRFYRRVCCEGFEEIDRLCYAKINCDVDGGSCEHNCVKGNTSHVCTCGEGYQLKNRTKCTEIPVTTTTATTSTSPTTTPTTTSIPSTTTRTTPTTTTTIPTTTTTTTKITPSTTTHVPSTTTQSSTTTAIGNKQPHGPPMWMLVVFPLLALLLILALLFCLCFCCRKRKPLYVKHDDEPTLTYENETYGRSGGATGVDVILPGKATKKKGHPFISQVLDMKQPGKSGKIIENDMYATELPNGKAPMVIYGNFVSEVCHIEDKDDEYLVAMSVFASGLPQPYVQKEPYYESVGQGAVGPLPMKEPLQGMRTAEIENTLNDNMENIYSEIP